jgi:hypothetical protein
LTGHWSTPSTESTPKRSERSRAGQQTTTGPSTTLDGRIDNFSQQSMALPAIAAAYTEDPLEAAIDAVRIAVRTSSPNYGKPFPHSKDERGGCRHNARTWH